MTDQQSLKLRKGRTYMARNGSVWRVVALLNGPFPYKCWCERGTMKPKPEGGSDRGDVMHVDEDGRWSRAGFTDVDLLEEL